MQPENEIKAHNSDIENGKCIMGLLITYYNNNQGKDLDEKQFNSLLDLLKPMVSLTFTEYGEELASKDYRCWCTKQFSQLLQSPSCELITLEFRHMNIDDQSIQYLSEALRQLTSLTLIDSRIGDQGIQYLSQALQSPNSKLVSLKLCTPGFCGSDKINAQGIQYLSKALQSQYCQLLSLNLSDNHIGDQGVWHLSQALQSPYCKLVALCIAQNDIHDQGMQYLSEALQSPYCKLTYLNCNDNNISDQGVQYLSQALMSPNCQLVSIYLGTNMTLCANPMSNRIFEIFAQVLKSPYTRLTSITISPAISSKLDGIELLTEAMQNNYKLTHINIIFCTSEYCALTCPSVICLIGIFLIGHLQVTAIDLTDSADTIMQPLIKRNKLWLTECCDFLKTRQWQRAQKLLDKGVSSNNAMLKMAEAGDLQAIQWLLQNTDAQINVIVADCDSQAPISELALKVPFPELDRNTPLHLAAARGHLDVVKWLVIHGAKLIKNYKDLSPLDLAIKNNHIEVVAFLKNFIMNPDQPEISQIPDNIEEKHQYRVDNTFTSSAPSADNLPPSYLQAQATLFQASSSRSNKQKTIELGTEHRFSSY